MSKELVISAASHERRVAILEEGQLVEIYIEREKEFALVGSIYKGKVTRVLPGMQSAFVDIGLDGDAFLYVSDVFENLEDYDHGHPHEQPQASVASLPPASSSPVEMLPGESLARAGDHHDEAHHQEFHQDETHPEDEQHAAHEEAHATNGEHLEEHHDVVPSPPMEDQHAEAGEERQPDSNASAPQNFAPRYNPTQNYPARSGSDRPGQNFGRGGDRGSDRGGDRGGDRGRGGRWGRRGGRPRGGRPPGAPGGRNLPPSKYASPQGGESRGYDNRGGEPRSYDNRRPEAPRSPAPPSSSVTEEEIILPGESLAKYRGKPAVAPAPAPTVEHETHEEQSTVEEITSRTTGNLPATAPSGSSVPRRFSGGLPRWLLADAGAEPEAPSATAGQAAETPQAPAEQESAPVRSDADLSEDQVAALAADFAEAKHEEATEEAEADAIAGGAEFDEEETEEQTEEGTEEAEETPAAEVSGLSEEEVEEVEAGRAANRAEFAADVAQEHAEDDATHSTHEHGEHEHIEDEHAGTEHVEEEVISAAPGESVAEGTPAIEDDVILLPGETRSPRVGGPAAPREDFPRDSARIGGNPRSRFQRPFRSGGRDRGRDSRGGRPDSRGGRPDGRGGRPDSRGGRPDSGGRPISGGPRFERRPSGPRQDRGYQGGRSGPSRRPQLISDMLKAGQDVVIQIAKEPLGKKGARITSHVALPGRFLVYMPTVHHTGVSRKIISAENRSRLRRLVSESGGAYPGGFIVRTAAGGATDDEIRTDIEFLGKSWNEIKERSEQRKAPSLLHRDLNLVERILRDYVSDDFTGIWIDNEEEYTKIVEFVSRFQPKLVNMVKLYTKETPIFEEFGIQHELDKALRAKVWLKSGGYIVINHTEALVAIDVNTGKFVGKGSTRLEDTIVKTNLEAVKEIVRQIRLRDLGGIIVVDFIDMEERRNREKVLSALQQALEEDKAPSKALSFNEFGLVCITRKRTKQALERVLCQPCPYCTGSGMVKSIPTLCYEIQSEARKMAAADHEGPNLTIRVNPEIAKALKTRESMLIDELEQTAHKHIIIQSDATLHWEQYDIY
ncbi:MAG TPA: Rne/Rng family ribonuclease [Candidatus Acidoferrum sp.]|nr:Rne/Rng family ribonuclease [Candidatus Acidoferrum sp.]